MSWTLFSLIAVALLVALGFGVLWLRRYVCLRRKDCCGKGCGCLWPAPRRR